ncbi:MAG: hypothetical protein IKG34_03875 [Solobacterium sp.]|nr:hypothetical protein [Solobacterium sp.]
MNKHQTSNYENKVLKETLERADTQIRVNETDIQDLHSMITDMIAENERMISVLDQNDRTEGICRHLLQYQYRHDLINKCACMIMDGRFAAADLIRIFPHSIYTEAARLLEKAYTANKNESASDGISPPGSDESVFVQDPEVYRLFAEYEQIMHELDQKAETQEILRYLIRDRYRSSLKCLCVKYILTEGLSVNDLKGMFGPDICAEAFLLYQKLQEQWFSETCSCA